MVMRRALGSAMALAIATQACNLPSIAPTQAAATPAADGTGLPTVTSLPTLPVRAATEIHTEVAERTPTPDIPVASPKDQPVNCRYGPALGWEAVGALLPGQKAAIEGRNSNNTWWYVEDPQNVGGFCWVAMSVTDAAGNTAAVPIVGAPTAVVTGVTVGSEVTFIACGEPSVIQFGGSITANGPATVSYQWEIRGDKENTTDPENLVFDEAGTQQVPEPGAYTADCGNYSIRLRVLSPNQASAVEEFAVGD